MSMVLGRTILRNRVQNSYEDCILVWRLSDERYILRCRSRKGTAFLFIRCSVVRSTQQVINRYFEEIRNNN